jgi:hypothetical protein
MAEGTTAHPPPIVLMGDASVLPLVHRILAQRAMLHGMRPVIVDCGGVFDPHAVALEARRAGHQPEAALNALLICRAFTGYQELHALRRLARFAPGRRVYLLNPLQVLLDEDLPAQDRPWLFNQLLTGLDWLSGHGHAVRVCQQSIRASPLAEAPRFEAVLAHRYPLIVAKEGRLQAMTHGQVGIPLQPRDRQRRGAVRALSPRAA